MVKIIGIRGSLRTGSYSAFYPDVDLLRVIDILPRSLQKNNFNNKDLFLSVLSDNKRNLFYSIN